MAGGGCIADRPRDGRRRTCGCGAFVVTLLRAADLDVPGGRVAVGGRCGVPSTARAVSVNLTVVSASGDGYVVVFPGDMEVPVASNVNFPTATTRSNNSVASATRPADQYD